MTAGLDFVLTEGMMTEREAAELARRRGAAAASIGDKATDATVVEGEGVQIDPDSVAHDTKVGRKMPRWKKIGAGVVSFCALAGVGALGYIIHDKLPSSGKSAEVGCSRGTPTFVETGANKATLACTDNGALTVSSVGKHGNVRFGLLLPEDSKEPVEVSSDVSDDGKQVDFEVTGATFNSWDVKPTEK